MANKEYQLKYRKLKESDGWRYFSIMVPEACYFHLKKEFLQWKSNNLKQWEKLKIKK